jgi:hypothetical protein
MAYIAVDIRMMMMMMMMMINIKRRDRVCAKLHFNVCKEPGIKLDREP